MNGLDKIIARMESDIRAECDALAANAAENAAAIRRDCQAQADAVTRDSAQRAAAQAAEHLEHLNGSSQLACRQRVLAAKQQLIDEAFARTAQALTALPQAAKRPGAAFRLSDETRDTGGGLVLRRDRVELNCSFTEKLRQLRQEESSAVAQLLFD